MTEEQVPQTSFNRPRPARLVGNTNTFRIPETPPLLPSIDDFEIEAYDTLEMPLIEPITNGYRPRVAQDGSQLVDSSGMDTEISTYPTAKMQVAKPAEAKPISIEQARRPIYASTGYARRLERRQRAREKKLSWKDLRQFGQFVVPFKWYIVLAFFLTVGVGLTAIPLPFIFRTMLDQVFHSHDISLFIWSLAFLLAVFFLEEVLSFFNRNVQGSLSRATNLNITHKFYKHMLRLPLSFYQTTATTGQALSRLSEVTSAQQTVIQVLLDTAVNIVLVIIYTVVLFLTDWRLTLVVIAVSPFYVGVSLYFNRRVRQLSREVLESYAVMNGAMYEGLTGLKTVKALAAEHRFGRTIKKLIMYTNTLSFKRTIFQSEANLMIGIVQALAVIVILSFGGYLVLTNGLTAGALAAYILILRQLSSPVTTLNGVNQQLQAAAVAIDRLFEVLNYPEEADAEKGIQLPNIQGHITFEHVHFSYVPGIEVLHDINLDVRAGATIALVGRSGAGKTTIANLLMRFYAPDSGRVTIDGYDLRELKIESLRSQFGVILQDDSLFSGTIEDNLKFGLLRKVSQEEMEEAARNANILDFIESQPLGFQTPLHERGHSLSVGQRQRIAIARMFLHQPKILIMDEPSSALDNESESLIQQAVKRLTAGRTTFIIAHRLSTIRNADRIVTIDDGRVVEQGTHEELLARRGVYWHLYNSYGRM
ncbi:MAG TPA: peptidase domain-containing ABC transporter [Ktedonobacteraceae bacterium]|nr:peptidase domain-containing ABC transporter [Ktedonobacteraceae bacterium]